jgi:hypothetical protein
MTKRRPAEGTRAKMRGSVFAARRILASRILVPAPRSDRRRMVDARSCTGVGFRAVRLRHLFVVH